MAPKCKGTGCKLKNTHLSSTANCFWTVSSAFFSICSTFSTALLWHPSIFHLSTPITASTRIKRSSPIHTTSFSRSPIWLDPFKLCLFKTGGTPTSWTDFNSEQHRYTYPFLGNWSMEFSTLLVRILSLSAVAKCLHTIKLPNSQQNYTIINLIPVLLAYCNATYT